MPQSCYLCSSNDSVEIASSTRDREGLRVLRCSGCGLVQLETKEHIHDSFYTESGMYEFAEVDIAKIRDEAKKDDLRRAEFIRPLVSGKSYLDVGAGHAGVPWLVRDVCEVVGVVEPNQRMRSLAYQDSGFQIYSDLLEVTSRFDVISMFHVLEHIDDPIAFLINVKRKLKNQGKLVVEVPNSNDALLSLYQCQAFNSFTHWSCHLFEFSSETLTTIAKRAGFDGIRVHQVQRYPLSNHLYWLSQGKPGGHNVWSFFDTEAITEGYVEALRSKEACDTLVMECW